MSIGIWSMHYVGMLAFTLPVPVVSLAAGNLSAALALFVVSRQKMGAPRALGASIFMGSGIAAMHYTAMRLPAMCHYSLPSWPSQWCSRSPFL